MINQNDSFYKDPSLFPLPRERQRAGENLRARTETLTIVTVTAGRVARDLCALIGRLNFNVRGFPTDR